MGGTAGAGQEPGVQEGPDRPPASSGRNLYIDFLRGFSIVVVVLWHWAFTIVRWGPDGPAATNPLEFTSGLWVLTWIFQVMPLFFYVGGYVHLRAWERAQARGESLGFFVWRTLRKLSVPALGVGGAWVLLGLGLTAAFDLRWLPRTVLLVISPLWFIGIYVLLIALIPLWLALHRRWGVVALVWTAGLVVIVDILRFNFGIPDVGYANLVLVWGLAFQLGFYFETLVRASRQIDLALLWAGLFALVGLVASGLYPGSMVGVPGQPTSNMSPPTLVIVALLIFQIGLAESARPWLEPWISRPRRRRVVEFVNRYALPLFLFHTTGMAIARGLSYAWTGQIGEGAPDLAWWLTRPLYVALSIVCTLPVIWLFGRFNHRPSVRERSNGR